ncbi:hypothetical protein ABW636_06135 [Aquimarina sp. 2201CG1-2-11]|uniref:hypothetical protein n=1 Tax=Aquimarina discodermiae TaxID=3231043 RepID=UPI003461EDE8
MKRNKLTLKKIQISNLEMNTIRGGAATSCFPDCKTNQSRSRCIPPGQDGQPL